MIALRLESLKSTKPLFVKVTTLLGAVLLFLMAIQLIGDAFSQIGSEYAQYILQVTANPSIGLFIGLLSTAILQSSSTTTSMTVAAVAAGSLSLEHAIPIVMGANVGTTLTSTIVSLSYVTKTAEFRKAVSAGSIHDIFNVLVCIILFPLEVNYGILTKSSHFLAGLMKAGSGQNLWSDKLLVYRLFSEIGTILMEWVGPYVLLLLAVIILFAIVKFISGILYARLIGNARDQFESVAFQNTFRSFGWGFLLTSAIQSSSLTTSLIVPLVATGKVRLKRAFQFVMGANMGTTITAILAALFKSEAAISLALAHFIFNAVGVILFLTVPMLSRVPIYLAGKLGAFALRFKLVAFSYILLLFFILPFTLIYFSRQKNHEVSTRTEEVSIIQTDRPAN